MALPLPAQGRQLAADPHFLNHFGNNNSIDGTPSDLK